MKLHTVTRAGLQTITAHGAGFVAVNGQRLTRSLLLTPTAFDVSWGPQCYAELAAEHIAALAELGCEVLLLGTGARQHFPPPALLQPLRAAGIAVEPMDTAAACRTYNILAAEGRAVAAALIIE